jgi:hypothetical protein
MVPVNPQEHIVRYISPNTVINGRPTPYSYELRTHLDEKDVSFVHVEYYGNYNINKTYVDLRTQNNFIKNKKSGLLAEHLVDKF